MKLVSIVIPVYNCANSLSLCVDSVLAQTYEKLDILLIDDGSNDNSYYLCLEYKEKDSRIRVFHHENHGVSFTRNIGIENANGDYIMFIDSDDTVMPEMVEHYISTIDNCFADIVIGGIIFDREGNFEKVLPPQQADCAESAIEYIIQNNGGIFGYVPNKMYSAVLLKSNGIRFPEHIPVQEDLLFFLDAVVVAKRIVTIQYAGYVYDYSEGDKKAEHKLLIRNQIRIIEKAQKYSSIDISFSKRRLGNLLTEGLMNSRRKTSKELINDYISIEGLSKNLDPSIMDSANSRIIVWLSKHKFIHCLNLYLRLR